jgi:peptide-methionine (R)-S-oxide reductase
MPKVASQPSRRELLALLACGAAAAVAFPGARASASGQFRVSKAPADWRRQLGPQRFQIMREAGTEYPYSSPLNSEHRAGIFACAGCAQPLFSSSTKFESHTGWPSFYKPLRGAVVTKADRSLFMARTEVLCSRCGGHLGHVFNDGPKPTGLRYCMNGLAMTFALGRAA